MSASERPGMPHISVPGLQSNSGLALGAASAPQPAFSPSGLDRRTGVAVVDEFPLRRASTLHLLCPDIDQGPLAFGSVDDLLEAVGTKAPALCCVVLCVGGRSVRKAPVPKQLRTLRGGIGSTPVIMLSDRDEPEEAIAALRQGVRGYIPTSLEPSLAIEALRIVLAGSTFVPADTLIRSGRGLLAIERLPCRSEVMAENREKWPPRQLAVLRMLAQGKPNKQIATALMMEETTVKVHVRQIIGRLGVRNRTQAALYARRQGIGDVEDGVVDPMASVPRPESYRSASLPGGVGG